MPSVRYDSKGLHQHKGGEDVDFGDAPVKGKFTGSITSLEDGSPFIHAGWGLTVVTGISGSLTKLTDGTSFIVAGVNASVLSLLLLTAL